MNLPTRLAPVAGVLEESGLVYKDSAWRFSDPGSSYRYMLDSRTAERIAESILAEHLEAKGDLTCGHMDGEKPPHYCTSYATGRPVTFGGETKLDCLISACLATKEKD